MVMGYVWTGIVLLSILAALATNQGSVLASAAMEGAQEAFRLVLAMGGSLCLWSGAGRLMELSGITASLSRLLKPVLRHVFPSSQENPELAGALSGNVTANLLGLGNAATPMGIRAAKLLKPPGTDDILPAVWVTSLLSAGLGVAAATLLGKVWKR